MAERETISYQSIEIETVDQAIVDWFDKTVDSHVVSPNGDLRKVPVLFAAGRLRLLCLQLYE